MAIRTIRFDGDPILRKKSKEVPKVDDRIKVLIEDMNETMDDAQGVGLAAPQVGILKRIVTIDNRDGIRIAMINPKIVESEGEEEGQEGCLSVPEKFGYVKRATSVKVEYLDQEGEEQTIEAEEFLARIIQHELDHLEGILYTDRTDKIFEIEEDNQEEEEL